jgi:uncharacterized protein
MHWYDPNNKNSYHKSSYYPNHMNYFQETGLKRSFSQFNPISHSVKDELLLPEGYQYDIVATSGEDLGNGEKFGFNNDFTCYFGNRSDEGVLWVNHEYIGNLSMYVTGYKGNGPRTPEQVEIEKYFVGGSVIHIKKTDQGNWKIVKGSRYNRRITANTPMLLAGPVKGAPVVNGATMVIGTFANCSGGKSLWNTTLSCEENIELTIKDWSVPGAGPSLNPTHYGWVVEVDPLDPQSTPIKHTSLGRFSHENVVMTVGKSGRIVVYSGDDENDECVYKFVSDGIYYQELGKQNRRLLEKGTLYVANLSSGEWIPLDLGKSPVLKEKYFTQAEVLADTRGAAKLVGGTPLDRPEDIEIHPKDGSVFIALTNNIKHGNYYGQIIRLVEKNNDHESLFFNYEIFAVGGPQSGFACPDNLIFEQCGHLWVTTDVASSSLNVGAYKYLGNNGLFMIPTEGPNRGKAFQFASAPVQAEFTGPWFSPDEQTLFLSVKHPGEETKDPTNPTSRWPYGGIPLPSVIALSRVSFLS